jgi:predicted nuclease with TOPRIM domain
MCRLEKLRSKLEREISSQKPSIEQIGKKKEELSKNLELSADKEIALSKEFELAMQNLGNEEMKQIVSDAMRMKQLEVLHSTFYVATSFQNFNHDFFIKLFFRLPFKRRKTKTRT